MSSGSGSTYKLSLQFTLYGYYIPSEHDILNVNIALRRFLQNHGNIATEGSPKPGLCSTHIEWPQGLFIVHSTIDSTAHSIPMNSLEHDTLSQGSFNAGPAFADDGSTLKQHWVNVSCLLPYIIIIGTHSKLETFPGVGLLPNQRLRRWANIKPTLDKYIFFVLWVLSVHHIM